MTNANTPTINPNRRMVFPLSFRKTPFVPRPTPRSIEGAIVHRQTLLARKNRRALLARLNQPIFTFLDDGPFALPHLGGCINTRLSNSVLANGGRERHGVP